MVILTRKERFIHAAVLLALFGITLVDAFEVRIGPSENFKRHSQVIFLGEPFALSCLVKNVTRMDITNLSLFLNGTLVVENKNLIVSDFDRRELTNGYELIINHVSAKHVGEYTCAVMVGMKMIEASYKLTVETKSPRCITKYCNEEDNFELTCYANISDDELSDSFRWEKVDDGGMAEIFVHFQTQMYNSGRKIVSKTNNKVKLDDSIRYYKCIVLDGQGSSNENEKVCYFDLRNFMSSTSVPMTTTLSVSSKTDVLKVTSTHQGELINNDTMEDNNSSIVVVIVLLGLVVLTICVLVTLYLLVKRNLQREKANSKSKVTEDLNYNSDPVSSFTFSNPTMMDLRTGQLSVGDSEDTSVAYYDVSSIQAVSVKTGPTEGDGRSGPDVTAPYEEMNFEVNDNTRELRHRLEGDVNETSTGHVDYECLKENKGEEIHYHVLDPSGEDTIK